MLVVENAVGVMLVPSTFAVDTPVVPPLQLPLGTYATTFAPVTSAASELEPWQEPGGGGVIAV